MYNRRSIRLKGYDYSSDGYYFITICTYKKQQIFGAVKNGIMYLNDYGKIAHNEWIKSDQIRNELKLDEFIIMPDHMHGIVIIDNRRGAWPCAPAVDPKCVPVGNSGIGIRLPKSISSFIAGYKSSVTTQINRMRNTRGEKIWQRNYYDHIIRSEKDYYRIAEYIRHNPEKSMIKKYPAMKRRIIL